MIVRIVIVCLLLVIGGAPIAEQSDSAYVETARIGRGNIDDLFWSPDGLTLAVTTARGIWFYQTDDLTVAPRLIEIDTQPAQRETSRWLFRYQVVGFDAEWQRVAVDEQQHGVTIREVATGTILTQITREPDRLYQAFAFSPDGQTLATGVCGYSGLDIDLYDTSTGTLIRAINADADYAPNRLSYSGNYLVVNGKMGGGDFEQDRLFILDAATDEIVFEASDASVPAPDLDLPPIYLAPYAYPTLLLLGSPTEDFSLNFIDDNDTLAITAVGRPYLTPNHRDDYLQIKNISSGEVLLEYPQYAPARLAAFAPDGMRLAFVDAENQLLIVSTGRPPSDDRFLFGCADDDDYCITGTDPHSITLPQLETITNTSPLSLQPDQYISADGRWLVEVGWQVDNIVHVTRTADDTVFALELGDPLPVVERSEPGDDRTDEGQHDPYVVAARVSPDGH